MADYLHEKFLTAKCLIRNLFDSEHKVDAASIQVGDSKVPSAALEQMEDIIRHRVCADVY